MSHESSYPHTRTTSLQVSSLHMHDHTVIPPHGLKILGFFLPQLNKVSLEMI
jgi:hypothetical protein